MARYQGHGKLVAPSLRPRRCRNRLEHGEREFASVKGLHPSLLETCGSSASSRANVGIKGRFARGRYGEHSAHSRSEESCRIAGAGWKLEGSILFRRLTTGSRKLVTGGTKWLTGITSHSHLVTAKARLASASVHRRKLLRGIRRRRVERVRPGTLRTSRLLRQSYFLDLPICGGSGLLRRRHSESLRLSRPGGPGDRGSARPERPVKTAQFATKLTATWLSEWVERAGSWGAGLFAIIAEKKLTNEQHG